MILFVLTLVALLLQLGALLLIVRYLQWRYRFPTWQLAWSCFLVAALGMVVVRLGAFALPLSAWDIVIRLIDSTALFWGYYLLGRAILTPSLPIPPLLPAIIDIDTQSVIRAWDIQATLLFGWTDHEALGQRLETLIIPPRLRAVHLHGMERYLADPATARVLDSWTPLPALHKNGAEFVVEVYVERLIDATQTPFFRGRVRKLVAL